MKSFTHISKQWLVINRLVENWRRFVLAWIVEKRQLNI
jgi:hypothetical protein